MNKKNFIILYISILFFEVNAQNINKRYELNLYYNWKFIGDVISIDFNKNIKNHSVTLGSFFYLNKDPKNFYPFAYKDRAFADKFYQRFGYNFGYKYSIDKNILIPFTFLNLQYSSIHFKQIGLLNDSIIVKFNLSNEYRIYECLIGIGINIKLYKSLCLYQSVGLGYSLMFNKTNRIPLRFGGFEGEYAKTYRIGLSYFFGKINK